jgi:signal transduction histidine kinase
MVSVTFITLLVMSISLWSELKHQRKQAEEELRQKARIVTGQFLAVRTLMVESRSGASMTEQEQYRHIDPAPLQGDIGEIFGSGAPVTLKEAWSRSKTPANAPDAGEWEFIREFVLNPELNEISSIEVIQGRRVFRYLIPIRMKESCQECHAKEVRRKSPAYPAFAALSELDGSDQGKARNERNIPSELIGRTGRPLEHRIGETAGAISFKIPMDSFEAALRTRALSRLVFTFVLITLSVVSIHALMAHLVTNPLQKLAAICAQIGRGHGHFVPLPQQIGARGELAHLAEQFGVMAKRLTNLYQNLEDQVADRTKELMEANQELAKANRLKSEFLASVSHELRTPLTSIIAFTELMLERIPGDLSERQEEYLQDIFQSSRRLLTSINDLLDLAKIEAGRMQLVLSDFPVGEVLSDVDRQMRPVAIQKGIRLNCESCPELPVVRADRSKVEQVILNLVSNAIKFTPSGGTVTLFGACQDESSLVIMVRDTGIGIRREDQALIFESFRQADSPTSRSQRGWGLGLALAKHLVGMHGGQIWVDSEPGKGSTFFFTIPVDPDSDCANPPDTR